MLPAPVEPPLPFVVRTGNWLISSVASVWLISPL
jgi:hypothetical protein